MHPRSGMRRTRAATSLHVGSVSSSQFGSWGWRLGASTVKAPCASSLSLVMGPLQPHGHFRVSLPILCIMCGA
eukprot:12936931-Prorocentrum_lima.AAC.1